MDSYAFACTKRVSTPLKWQNGAWVRAVFHGKETCAAFGTALDEEVDRNARLDVAATADHLDMNIHRTKPLDNDEDPSIWVVGLD